MPIFEYGCRKCGHEFETLVRNGTAPDCPGCGSTELEKKLSVPAKPGASAQAAPAAMGPCGSCGHPGGPGSCALH
jgi:putative FmdB family regulatory protein